MKLDNKETKELRSGSYRIIDKTAPMIYQKNDDHAIANGYMEALRQMMDDNSKNPDLTV